MRSFASACPALPPTPRPLISSEPASHYRGVRIHAATYSALVGDDIDNGIIDLVEALNRSGVVTLFSCEGEDTRPAYIAVRESAVARGIIDDITRLNVAPSADPKRRRFWSMWRSNHLLSSWKIDIEHDINNGVLVLRIGCSIDLRLLADRLSQQGALTDVDKSTL